jgi:hypothetical protein
MSNDFYEQKEREIPPEGKHPARLIWAIDLGTHDSEYEGVKGKKHQIYLCWELVDTAMTDGRPFVMGKRYTVSNGQYGVYIAKTSGLHKMLRQWQGWPEKAASKVENVTTLLHNNAPAFIQVAHQPKRDNPTEIFAYLELVKPYAGLPLKKPVNPTLGYAIGGDNLEAVTGWLKKEIVACYELNGGLPPREVDFAYEEPVF